MLWAGCPQYGCAHMAQANGRNAKLCQTVGCQTLGCLQGRDLMFLNLSVPVYCMVMALAQNYRKMQE